MNLNKITHFAPDSNLLIISLFFLIALLLRIIAIDVPLTTDETLWLSRGHDFINGILARNLKDTYQKHHPGVINMWVIGISQYLNFWILKIFPEGFNSFLQYPVECLNDSPSYCPINAYIMPRFIQGIITSACMGGFYWFNQELFGKWRAILATCFLLFSPFFLGYQRFITTDALQVDFCILGLLSFLLYLVKPEKIQFILLSSFFLTLGILAKIPVLFYLPIIILILLLRELKFCQHIFHSIGWMKTFWHLSLFFAIFLFTTFCLWPILWNVFEYNYVLTAIFDTHLPRQATKTGIYFLGESKDYPNLLFYPLVLVYRLSPLTQIGLFALIISFRSKSLRTKFLYKKELIFLATFAIIPLIIFSLIPSKVDRYILLIYPQVICLATAGWFNLILALKQSRIKLGTMFIKARFYIIVLITIAFIIVIYCFPYYISFYNPLFGGTKVAEKIIIVGNGEGLDETARWLNQKPDAETLNVLSWYAPIFSSYFKGNVITTVTQADFVITYINQIQRNYDAEWIDYLKEKKPVYVFKLHGLEYVKVYQLTD